MRTDTRQSVVTPADGSSHIDLVLCIALSQLFIACMWNDLHWEILDEFSEVAPDVCNSYIERPLKFDEPVSICDLVGGEQVLLLSHLREGICGDYVLHSGLGLMWAHVYTIKVTSATRAMQ